MVWYLSRADLANIIIVFIEKGATRVGGFFLTYYHLRTLNYSEAKLERKSTMILSLLVDRKPSLLVGLEDHHDYKTH